MCSCMGNHDDFEKVLLERDLAAKESSSVGHKATRALRI